MPPWRTPRKPGIISPDFVEPCLPTLAQNPPEGPDWIHEIKHDGIRLIVRRRGARVRIFTKNGFDWTERYPRIVEAVGNLKVTSCAIDGEGVVCGSDGIADFERLRSRAEDHCVILYAFDLLELDGADVRREAWDTRKTRLAKLLAKQPDGIAYNDHTDLPGQAVYEAACKMGLEGIVSKRRDMPYRSGKCSRWRKIRNPKAPASIRIVEENWS